MKDEENKMQSAAPEQQAQPEQTQPESEPAADAAQPKNETEQAETAAQPGTENEPKAETTAPETPDKKKRPLWRKLLAMFAAALAVLVLLFTEDWRMGLSMLIVVPLGIICFMSMFSGYNEKFQRTVTATKALNDTAVEYISGIEVIKAATSSRDRIGVCISILLNTQEPRL